MKFLVALAAGGGAAFVGALLLWLVAIRMYYGGHGLIGGFETWHLIAASALLLIAFAAGAAAVLLTWSDPNA